MAIYMKYGSIKGLVETEGFKDWIELTSFRWGMGRGVGSATGSSKEREASAPSISEITVTKDLDQATNGLLMDAMAGQLNTTVQIKFTTTTKNQTETFLTYELTNCGLSGYSVDSGGDRPSESLSLNFTKLTTTYAGKDSAGNASPNTVGYDLAKMQTV